MYNAIHLGKILWFGLCLLGGLVGLAHATNPVEEPDLKAAYIFNFIQFIEWPDNDSAMGSELTVCVSPFSPLKRPLTALEGKQAGDELNVSIEPEDAYGEYLAELVSTLNRSMFEGVDELEVGMQFHASAPDGQMQIVTIRDLDGDDVTVDGNHPLAGQRLTFQVKIVAIRDASQEEVAHGHVHGEGGHHH